MKFPSMNTYHLIVFYFVATHKNISTAAEELCLNQPTVTKHVKNLENTLGMKLIEVKRKRVVLTSAGEGLYLLSRVHEWLCKIPPLSLYGIILDTYTVAGVQREPPLLLYSFF